MTRRRLMAVCALLIVAVVCALAALAVYRMGERPRGDPCVSSLKQVGIVLRIIAERRNGAFPDSIAVLGESRSSAAPEYSFDDRLLRCPESNQPFEYLPGFRTTDPADLILAFDHAGSHAGGSNALFLDGHVEWVPEPYFESLHRKSIEYLKAQRRQAPALTD